MASRSSKLSAAEVSFERMLTASALAPPAHDWAAEVRDSCVGCAYWAMPNSAVMLEASERMESISPARLAQSLARVRIAEVSTV